MKQSNKKYLFLYIICIIYSFSTVFSKMAATQSFASKKFFLFYGLVIVCLGVYAALWQQILKRMPLNKAYANKSVVIVFGIIWGYLFFGEQITFNKVIGAFIIIMGVYFMVSENE